MWIAAGFATMVAAFAAAACLVRPGRRIAVRGSWPELRDQVATLCERRRKLRGLRVILPDVEEGHLRIMRERGGLRLELPATTPAERAHESAFREACTQHDLLATTITRPSDRKRVVTTLLPCDQATAADNACALVDATFGLGEDAEIHVIPLF